MYADDCHADNLQWLAMMQSYSVLNVDYRLRFDAIYRELKALRQLEGVVKNTYVDNYTRHAAVTRDALDEVTASRHQHD